MRNQALSVRQKQNLFYLYLLVCATLVGGLIYIKFAALYHFVVVALLLVVLLRGFSIKCQKTDIMIFFLLWMGEALISVLWAPDRTLALQYVYYIFLLVAICFLFNAFLTKQAIKPFCNFMILLLFVCNWIAFWEILTGNHLVKDYLTDFDRARILQYVPGLFFWNPNDFATYIIQIIPFSLAGVFNEHKWLRMIAIVNIVMSLITVFATQSRTQIILLVIIYFCFFAISKKIKLIKLAVGALILVGLLVLIFPELRGMLLEAWHSISRDEIASSATNGGSLETRFRLLGNGLFILWDTFGFGIGAGCHRAVMGEYAVQHYATDGVTVMHNLLGEIFVDYGIFIGIVFMVVIAKAIVRLYKISKNTAVYETKMLSLLLAISLGLLIICGMSSSSILQLSSLWVTVCFISAFMKVNDDGISQKGIEKESK